MIDCNGCGECCSNLTSNPLYATLDRGDGVCRFLNVQTKLCSIYDQRPDICNSLKMYEQYFHHLSKQAFINLNRQICEHARQVATEGENTTFFRA